MNTTYNPLTDPNYSVFGAASFYAHVFFQVLMVSLVKNVVIFIDAERSFKEGRKGRLHLYISEDADIDMGSGYTPCWNHNGGGKKPKGILSIESDNREHLIAEVLKAGWTVRTESHISGCKEPGITKFRHPDACK